MKKILTAVMALFITTGLVQAQDQNKSSSATPAATQPAAAKCDMKNCCMMKDGKLVQMKDGKEIAMTEDVKLGNGTLVHKDGSMDTKDGKKMMLKDGECIDMNGTMGRVRLPRTSTTESAPAQPTATPVQIEQVK